MFKMQNETSLAIMSRIFSIAEHNYIIRNNSNFEFRCIDTVHYGSESLSQLSPKLWRILSNEYKQLSSLNEFKSKIKTCVPSNYPLCNVLDLFNFC